MPPPDSARVRTRLSWRRTSLVATVVALLLVRLALHEGTGAGVIGVAALCWVGLLLVVQRRVNALAGRVARGGRWALRKTAAGGRPRRADPRQCSTARPVEREVVLTAAATVAFGVLGVVLVVR